MEAKDPVFESQDWMLLDFLYTNFLTVKHNEHFSTESPGCYETEKS